MGRVVRFFVPGLPKPQGSKRHVGKGRMVESSDIGPWRDSIGWVAKKESAGTFFAGPTQVDLIFYLPAPKKYMKMNQIKRPRWCSTRPDADKLARAALDALTDVLFPDDCLVVDLRVSKMYAYPPEVPAGVAVTVREVLI